MKQKITTSKKICAKNCAKIEEKSDICQKFLRRCWIDSNNKNTIMRMSSWLGLQMEYIVTYGHIHAEIMYANFSRFSKLCLIVE